MEAVLLFDVDLTLIDTGGAGREAMNRAFRDLLGVDDAFQGVQFAGRTDRDLLGEALRRHCCPPEQARDMAAAIRQAYLANLEATLRQKQGHCMPGVERLLLRLSGEPAVVLGLATGNFRRAAELKLEHYGLLRYFRGGGFGDDHEDRKLLVADAAREVAGAALEGAPPPWVLVIGDTPRDVAAALANGFLPVGVATGFHSREDLRQAGACLVFPDFDDDAAAARAMLQLASGGGQSHEAASLEREAKFAVAGAAALEALRQLETLPGGYRLGPPTERQLTDEYLDTTEHALLRHGWALRLRHGGGKTKVSLKALAGGGSGAVHCRSELEGQVPCHAPLDMAGWPEAGRELVIALAGSQPQLRPTAYVEHARQVRDVWGTEDPGRPLGELEVESVVVLAPPLPDRADLAPTAVATFGELELEARPSASDEELETLSRAVGQIPGLEPSASVKLARALRAVARHPVGYPTGTADVQARMQAYEAARLIWRAQLVEMLLNEAGARRGDDIDYVHDMRVATRRARAAADIFGPFLDRRAVRPLRKCLKRTGRALGPVRDLDVALLKLGRYREAADPGDGPDLRVLADSWIEQRRSAHAELLAWIDSQEYGQFLAELEAYCRRADAPPAKKGGAATGEVRHVMPVAIVERFAAVRAHETELGGVDRPEVRQLHTLRIDCKRLRYGLEFVRQLLGDEGEQLIGRLKALQDHLGELNDAVVTRERLRKLERSGPASAAVLRYSALQAETVDRLRGTLGPVWLPFVAAENRELLMAAVARL